MIRPLNNNTYYIGTDDLDLDLFESQYIIPEGISYNSYLILDKKTAILDTVDDRKGEEWLNNLDEALGDRIPNYLIVHHLEPDHSGMIKRLLEKYPSIVLVASQKALQMLPQFVEDYPKDQTLGVKDGDIIPLGEHQLKVYGAPMIHWPEVIMTYEETYGSFYAADGFGKFGALEKCGFYGHEDDDWTCEARRYFFNIVGKYGTPVQNLLKKIGNLSIQSIRPLHGPILEKDLGKYISLYDTWSKYKPETEGVFIAYASIHGGTAEAANKLKDILTSKKPDMKIAISDLCRSDFAENVEDAFRYSKMVVAASSYDGTVFTPMYHFLHLLQVKAYSSRKVGIIENGSWAPCAGRIMKEMLEKMKDIEILPNTVTILSKMKAANIPALEELADALLE